MLIVEIQYSLAANGILAMLKIRDQFRDSPSRLFNNNNVKKNYLFLVSYCNLLFKFTKNSKSLILCVHRHQGPTPIVFKNRKNDRSCCRKKILSIYFLVACASCAFPEWIAQKKKENKNFIDWVWTAAVPFYDRKAIVLILVVFLVVNQKPIAVLYFKSIGSHKFRIGMNSFSSTIPCFIFLEIE